MRERGRGEREGERGRGESAGEGEGGEAEGERPSTVGSIESTNHST